MPPYVIALITGVSCSILFGVLGYLLSNYMANKAEDSAKARARQILDEAEKNAQQKASDATAEAKENLQKRAKEIERDQQKRRVELERSDTLCLEAPPEL